MLLADNAGKIAQLFGHEIDNAVDSDNADECAGIVDDRQSSYAFLAHHFDGIGDFIIFIADGVHQAFKEEAEQRQLQVFDATYPLVPPGTAAQDEKSSLQACRYLVYGLLPACKTFLMLMTGTGLLSYIRPVDGGLCPWPR